MTAIVMQPGAPALASGGGVGVDTRAAADDGAEAVAAADVGVLAEREGAEPAHEMRDPARIPSPRQATARVLALTPADTP